MTQDLWLTRHPYLQPIAQFHREVDAAIAEAQLPSASVPSWESYSEDYAAGIPLLRSSAITIDFSPAERVIAQVVANLARKPLPRRLAEESRALHADLRDELDASGRVRAWLLDRGDFASAHPGLLRYLGWSVLARFLDSVVGAFRSWREEQHWLRAYCPTCGSPPAMAQLIGRDPGRLRFFSCGCCGTRWRFRRTGCPFCEQADHHQLAVIAIEGEEGLRIDYCESCRGYVKTYNGEGSEAVLLADWSSLHLDILAQDRGLKRRAASLYEIGTPFASNGAPVVNRGRLA